MSYQKTNWVNGYTPLNASNMNKIEEGIFSNDTFLSSLDVRVEDLEGKIGQGGINSVNVSGNGNAITNASYDSSTKILNLEKNTTFALDSDLDSVNDKNLYHLGAYDSVSGNVITRQTGYVNLGTLEWIRDSDYFAVLDFPSKYGSETYGDSQVANIICSRYQTKSALDVSSSGLGISITSWNAIYAKDGNYSDVNSFKASLQGVLLQYKLATSYTEEIIENQPLNTLGQSGSQWLRSEWEKGLNLLPSDYVEYNSDNTRLKQNVYLKAGTYTISFSNITMSVGSWQVVLNDSVIGTYSLTQNAITFIVSSDNTIFYFYANQSMPNAKFILNKGTHAYPYQEYRGGIARESQLIKVKTFSGDASTFSDFTSWIDSNNERVISIMYYERSSGGNNYYNVIFGSDGSVYKYIDSEGTLNNVTLSSGSEGADILKIYYI